MSRVNFKERAAALLKQELPPSEATQRIVERLDEGSSTREALDRCANLLADVTPESIAAEWGSLAPLLDEIALRAQHLANAGYALARRRHVQDDEAWLD